MVEQPTVVEPEPVVEEVKPTRPPLYYFEEVEEKRAREREQLAAWYQPIPEPAQEPERVKPSTPSMPTTASIPPVESVAAVAPLAAGVKSAALGVSAAAAAPVFSLAGSGTPRPQVKEGIGPQLPRPNRVRVPTRRELASYGIKLPSQRMAEEKAREEQLDTDAYSDDEMDAMQQDELARQFAQSQQHRYGEEYQDDTHQTDDEDSAAEAELARQFASSQQQRYSGEQPAGANPFSLDDFEFSPMKTLVDEGPHEPLFTPGVMPEPAPQYQEPVAPQQHYQQPAQPVAPQQHYQQPPQPVAPQQHYQQPAQPVAPQQHYQQPAQPVAPQQHYQQPAQPVAPQQHYQQPAQPVTPPPQDSLIHPLLMRNGDSRPAHRPSTPLPSLDLLTPPPSEVEPIDTFALEQMARLVEARLADFRIKADVVNYSPGPVITRFELNLAPGVKAARISNLSRDLARSLSTAAVRVVERLFQANRMSDWSYRIKTSNRLSA